MARRPLAWAGEPISGYAVTRAAAEGGEHAATLIVPFEPRSHKFGKLRPGGRYRVRIAAVNAAGTGPFGPWSDLVLEQAQVGCSR